MGMEVNAQSEEALRRLVGTLGDACRAVGQRAGHVGHLMTSSHNHTEEE